MLRKNCKDTASGLIGFYIYAPKVTIYKYFETGFDGGRGGLSGGKVLVEGPFGVRDFLWLGSGEAIYLSRHGS